jgi:hypothetical protein
MLEDNSLDKCSQWDSVSEYIRHFYVCNTNCGSFFLFVGKTGNTHTHGVSTRRTNTLSVESRRRIDVRWCVPSGWRLPLSFKTFRCVDSTDSGPLVPGFITPGELKPFLHSGFHNQRFFHWSHRTCRSANSLNSFNSSRVFGNRSWPLGVFRLHASTYCCTVFVVGRCVHFGPRHHSIGGSIFFFSFPDGPKPPSVIRIGWCGWSKPTIRHP